MSVQSLTEIKVAGETVVVTGDRVDTPSLRLFFRSVLGCHRTSSGWICPVRRDAPSDLVVRIANRVEREGHTVRAEGGSADLALKHDVERVRSFRRAREAAAALLALDRPAQSSYDTDEILRELHRFGWDVEARALFPHQRDGLIHALTAINAANFSVPGAGKTATALAAVASHFARDTIDLAVVVGPLSAFRPWEHEAGVALPRSVRVVRVRGANRGTRADLYRRARRHDVLLVTYATAVSDRGEIERLMRGRRVMLVVDESHRVKRFRGGQWAEALVAVARLARVRMILTGTPMPQGPRDLWSQFMILWPGEEATGSRVTFGARADNDFHGVIKSLEPFFIRTPKSALGLTPARFIDHPVDLSPIQAEVYELVARRLRTRIPDAARWQDKIDALRRARPIRLIQTASNPDLLNESDGFYDLPPVTAPAGTLLERLHRYRESGELPAKFRWTLEYLQELKRENRKCVVWTTFVRNIDQFADLVRRLVGVPVYSVDGRVPAADGPTVSPLDEIDETREERIDRFLNEGGAAVLVANPAACAESISLHSTCHRAVYLDRTYDCARWLQSIDRIHRLGLAPEIQVEIHVPKATVGGRPAIDELIDQSLNQKAARMSDLLEGAELRATTLEQDSLDVAEGSDQDLDKLLRYLLGEDLSDSDSPDT